MTRRQLSAQQRAECLREALEHDPCIKRAAFKLGLSYRTACRYRRERLSRCRVIVLRLRRQRLIAGLPIADKRTQQRERRDRLTMLRRAA